MRGATMERSKRGARMNTDTCLRLARATLVAVAAVLSLGACVSPSTGDRQAREVPQFEVDPAWPKLPEKWVFGQVSSVSIDDQGHAWILQRPSTVRTDQ